MKVVSMWSGTRRATNPAMRALYNAAGSVFALPDYEQVLAYRDGGPVPEPPYCVKDTPGGFYAVGRMISANGTPSVRIVTDGGREVIVEQNRVTVNFRTGLREASSEAAHGVLEHLEGQQGDEFVILVELVDQDGELYIVTHEDVLVEL